MALPPLMSLAALVLVLGWAALFGVERNADEGAPARLFQLLLAAQVPVMAYFAFKNLSRAPRKTLGILALQACAALVPIAVVAFLER